MGRYEAVDGTGGSGPSSTHLLRHSLGVAFSQTSLMLLAGSLPYQALALRPQVNIHQATQRNDTFVRPGFCWVH